MTWSPISATEGLTEPQVHALAFAPAAPDVAYAGAGRTVFRSADAGEQWTAGGTLSSTVQALAVHPALSGTLYAGTFNHGLHRSTDGGASWAHLTGGILPDVWVTPVDAAPVTPSAQPPSGTILYAGTWDGVVYRSTDDGDTWESLGHLGHVYAVLAHPQAASVVYAATSDHSVFRGSTLDHLTMTDVESPQHLGRAFSLTFTARDAMGLPPAGVPSAQLAALQNQDVALAATLATGGYNGPATLVDGTGTLTPTTATFVDGIAQIAVAIEIEASDVVITATVPEGLAVASAPFDVHWHTRVYVPVVMKMP